MKIVRLTAIAGVVLLLSACTVTVNPGSFDIHGGVGVSGGQYVNDRLNLRAYPGSVIVSQEQGGWSSQTTFETRASLAAVFDHFDAQLTGQGWRRSETEFKPNKVEAEYRRRDGELELELNRHGNSGRYHLEIDFGGDDD